MKRKRRRLKILGKLSQRLRNIDLNQYYQNEELGGYLWRQVRKDHQSQRQNKRSSPKSMMIRRLNTDLPKADRVRKQILATQTNPLGLIWKCQLEERPERAETTS